MSVKDSGIGQILLGISFTGGEDMGKRKEITFVNRSEYTGETLEELRLRIGDEEYNKRVQHCHDKAMAAIGLYRDGSDVVPYFASETGADVSTAAQ